MTELGRETIRCSGRVTSKRRSEYEVMACGFWELGRLVTKTVNNCEEVKMIAKSTSDHSSSPTQIRPGCISITYTSDDVWTRISSE